MKRLLSILLTIALSAILLSACGGGNTPSHDGGDITIVQADDLDSWDPNVTSNLWNGYIINNVYSKLFTFDENINGIPELTKEYTLISDTEWHFTIYDNVKTHDGNILTADDVVYSLNRAKGGTQITALFAPVEAITKVDEFTISITTNGPYPSLPTALTHQAACIVPKSYIEYAEANDDWSHPIGTGRYTFGSRMIGDNIVLNRFEDYYDQNDKAMNSSITFKIMNDASARTIAVETGEADLNINFNTMDYDMVQGNPDLTLHSLQSQSVWHLGMDCTNPNFENILVRQAVSFAIDRAGALEAGHNGHGTVMYNSSTFAPTCLGAVVNPLGMYEYNPVRAKELMAEAGVEGFDTEIVVFHSEAQRIATLVQANLAEIGINATINIIQSTAFVDMLAAKEVPMFITSWGSYWDPDLFLTRRFVNSGGVNRSHYFNEDLEPLILAGRASFDNDVRRQAYIKVQEFMAPEAPEVDLYVSIMFALARTGLKGVEINVERPFNFYKLHY